MPDQIFEHPRLVSVYDAFDGSRSDLLHYLAIVKEFGAKSVVDVGSGTGSLACVLAEHGFEVTGVEPASASLKCAMTKPSAHLVRWIEGDASRLSELNADLVLMTGNVGQVFLTDESLHETLDHIRRALKPNGRFVFEVRDPFKKAWLEWTKEKTHSVSDVPGVGKVEAWCDVTSVSGQLVSFRWTFVFQTDGQTLTSDSTLRFRRRNEIELALAAAGFLVEDVRDAPDRPGKEFVFVAKVLSRQYP